MGLFSQLSLSYQMTVAAFKMTMRYPATLLVALGSLVALVIAAVGPVAWMIYLAETDFDSFMWAMRYVFQFWFVEDAFASGDVGATASAFLLWLLLIYGAWMTIVAFVSLTTATVIMHTGMQQLRGERPSVADGFRVAGNNLPRLALLAVIAGTVMALVKRLTVVLRAVPFVGRFLRHAIIAALTGVLYLALPIVIYERKGPWGAVKSTWENIRKTWGGLVVGTGLVMMGLWFGLWFVWYMLLAGVEMMFGASLVEWSTILILQLMSGVALYCVNLALAANLRAALYLHVTEGHTGVIPEAAFVNKPVAPRAPAPKTYASFEVVDRR